MDTRTAVNQRNDLPSPVWDTATATQAAAPKTDRSSCSRRMDVARLGLAPDGSAAKEKDEDLSPDPLRHTDRYQLVMPYRLRL